MTPRKSRPILIIFGTDKLRELSAFSFKNNLWHLIGQGTNLVRVNSSYRVLGPTGFGSIRSWGFCAFLHAFPYLQPVCLSLPLCFYCLQYRWTVLFLSEFFSHSVTTITHEPLHLAGWNFARTCTFTTSGMLLNFKVVSHRSRSHECFFLCAWCCSYPRTALSKAWWSCLCMHLFLLILSLAASASLIDCVGMLSSVRPIRCQVGRWR